MNKKAYWSPVCCTTDRDKANIKSWFGFMCADMTPEKAEILCDIETDKEKKIRVLMVDKEGKRRWAIRAKTSRGVTITLKAA